MKKPLLMIGAAVSVLGVSAADWYVAPGGTGGGTSPSDRGDLMDVLHSVFRCGG